MAEGSIKSRIAALNLEEVHAPAPGTRPAFSYEHATAKKKPPPPPPGQRPGVQQRQQTINNPPIFSNARTTEREAGERPNVAKPPTPSISSSISPGLPPRTKTSPALPPRPPPRTSTTPAPGLPPRESPSLPPRKTPTLPPRTTPTLPPRKGSDHSVRRRESNESISTIASGISTLSLGSTKTGASNNGTLYQVRAPAFDPSKLPPLPPKKAPEEPKSRATLAAMKSTRDAVPTNRHMPPQLPSRPALPASRETNNQPLEEEQPRRKILAPPPTTRPVRSALEFGMNKSTETPPPIPTTRPGAESRNTEPGAPPPIPLASRPNLDAIMASKPKPGAVASCLKCRDFSRADTHAASPNLQRQNLPGSDVSWLAHQLCSPFPSHTDKARVLFTWLHHNVEYDAHSFFAGTVSPSTPERTITTGLAVCEGYASLFAALALKAGLEAIVVGGHGKGFGYSPMKPGDPVPEFKPTGHAWNAVRIDGGEWKLIDCCWGAGALGCPNRGEGYVKGFNPSQFTMDNNEFGWRHYPEDSRYFFRTDGRPTFSWEEYCYDEGGERLMVYGGATSDHGIGERTFQPASKYILLNSNEGPVVRFQFASVCAHWDNARHGKGPSYPMVLNIGGRDGRKSDWIPFNTDGKVWWADVNRVDLGAMGQKVSIFAVTTMNGQDARGMTMEEWKSKKGRVGMTFGGVAMYELA